MKKSSSPVKSDTSASPGLKLVLFVLAMLGIMLFASLIAAVTALASHVPAHTAGKITTCSEGLSWDANAESDISGYGLYVGTLPGTYAPPIDVPHAPAQRIIVPCADVGVVADGQYYFTVVARDLSGKVSPRAEEVSFFLDQTPATPGGLDVN